MKKQVDPVFDTPRGVSRAAPQSSQQTKRPAQTVRPDLNKIEAVGRPWWAEAPEIAHKCLLLIFAPFKLVAALMDMLVSMIFLSVFAVIGLWWMGYIPDATISQFIEILGNRVLGIIQKSGVL